MSASASVDWPTTLPLPLVGPPRTLQPRNETHIMESQRIRVRRYFTDYRELLDFEWSFTVDEFEIFKAFFEDDLCNGESPFIITFTDPDDSNMQSITDYGFFEGEYQWAYTDGVYAVTATVIIEEELIEAIVEPFDPDLCAVVIWPDVSDGSGGGNTFDCYDDGDYTVTILPTGGTGIGPLMWMGDNPFATQGEEFETFADGALVLGSPSAGSGLTVMYYGDGDNTAKGEEFEDYDDGAFTEGVFGGSVIGLTDYFLG
jgi:hypothetical protein